MASIQDRLQADTTIKVGYGDDELELEKPRFIAGYWSIRGLGAPIRMMLSAAQVNHWVALYDVTETEVDGWSQAAYKKDKEWLKKEHDCFMNLPFLVDCQQDDSTGKKPFVLAQTNAIMSYLGRELDMLGSNSVEQCRCEELLCEIMDLRNLMVRFAYNSDVSKGKEDAQALIESAAGHLDKLELYLETEFPDAFKPSNDNNDGSSVCHLVGGKFSAPDFHLWEMLVQFQGLCTYYSLDEGLCWGSRPYLKAFEANFRALPENKAYLECRPMTTLPFNNVYARFGSDPMTLGKYIRGQEAPWIKQGVVKDLRMQPQPKKKQKTAEED